MFEIPEYDFTAREGVKYTLEITSACVYLFQDSEGAEPKSLSLATLFGSPRSSKPDPISPVPESSAGKVARPPVARTLTYDDTVNSGGSVTSKVGNVPVPVCSEDAQQQQQQHGQPQHCPAIQKLMQGQRGVSGVLQTLSESPENRLCDNGVPLEHHHHLYHHQQQHQHHHHHHHQQYQPDPIKRLFQTQPPALPSSSFPPAAPSCCSKPPPLQQSPHVPSQPIMVDSVSCSHLQTQQSQQLFFSFSKPQPEAQHNSRTALMAQGTGDTSLML